PPRLGFWLISGHCRVGASPRSKIALIQSQKSGDLNAFALPGLGVEYRVQMNFIAFISCDCRLLFRDSSLNTTEGFAGDNPNGIKLLTVAQ
ncbi:MAG TPA: hypothetical protein VKP69_16915, partial [Isosphaeraceae bacterium]|nr:hypothetical protein [Isosphaeraceae bacterium]